jgi:fido (protein-threonine AMPylation protein)
MNDTKRMFNERQQHVWGILQYHTTLGPSQVLERLSATPYTNEPPSLITIKRDLDELYTSGYCVREGAGRATGYRLTERGVLLRPVSIDTYAAQPPDERVTFTTFNFSLFQHFPTTLLAPDTKDALDARTATYRERYASASTLIRTKELERFVIELSWKSSAIEGNTYTLLDTERLLKDGIVAPNHDPAEAQMIINHKRALQFVVDTVMGTHLETITPRFLEQVHELLVADLGVAVGPRKTLVGITGSAYTPLDNQHQIREALELLYAVIAHLHHPVEKALVALAGLSYIQPFEDGNKRTARLVSNALLLSHQYAPLSYRTVDIERYRSAMLVFYEQLSIVPVMDIFLDQYHFSTDQYLV